MMNALREQASGWVVKLLLGLLALSFLTWGVGDIFNRSGRDVTLAKVAGTSISKGAFDLEYQRKINELRSMLGSSYSPDIIKNLNMELQVLSGMVDQALIHKEAQTLGIVISDTDIQDAIRNNADFKGESGKFDLRTFQQVLEHNQLSEKRYYDSLRTQMSADILLSPLSGQKLFPQTLVDIMVASALERRNAEIIVIPENAVSTQSAPSEQEISDFYEAHKNAYSTAELREGKFIDIRFEDIMKTAVIPTEEIARIYKERIESFKQPETREVSQLLYEDEQTAKKAYDLLVAKTSLEQVAKKIAPTNTDKINLGFVKKSALPSNVASNVFSLKTGEFTKPLSSDFGWHIFQLTSIKPENVAPLEEVRAQIEKDLKQHAAEESIYATVNKLEDALAAGATLETAAKDLGLSVKSIPLISKEGLDVNGKKPDVISAYSNFASTLFNTDEKNQSAMTITNDGSYFVVETTKVIAARTKSLDEIKPELLAALNSSKRQSALQTKATALAAELAKGTDVAKAISASELKIKKVNGGTLTRNSVETGAGASEKMALPKMLVDELFSLSGNKKSTSAINTQEGGFVIAIVKNVTPASTQEIAQATSERTNIESQLAKDYANELYEQYIRHLRNKYDAQIFTDRLPKVDESAALNDQ